MFDVGVLFGFLILRKCSRLAFKNRVCSEGGQRIPLFFNVSWVQPHTSRRSKCAKYPASSLANLLIMRLWKRIFGFGGPAPLSWSQWVCSWHFSGFGFPTPSSTHGPSPILCFRGTPGFYKHWVFKITQLLLKPLQT